jgi:2-dehydro-3-deoxygluconokinase
VLPDVDWLLCGLEEGAALFGAGSPEALVNAARGAGARGAAVRIGERGAVVTDGSNLAEVPPRRLVDVRDEVGAGDGFAAGFAYGLLQGWDAPHCAHAGNVVAASVLTGTGDWETFPRLEAVRDELERPVTREAEPRSPA